MKKLGIPFTKNIDDGALFLLFKKFLHEKVVENAIPMLKSAYFLSHCDNNFDDREKLLLETFVSGLNLDKDVKENFLKSFFLEVKNEFNSCKPKNRSKYIAKIYNTQSIETKKEILKFCYLLALIDENITSEEIRFHSEICKIWKIGH